MVIPRLPALLRRVRRFESCRGHFAKGLVSGREPVHVRSLRWSAARLPPPRAPPTTSRPPASVVTGSWLAAVLGIQSRGVLSATATSSRPGPDGGGRPRPLERAEAAAGAGARVM